MRLVVALTCFFLSAVPILAAGPFKTPQALIDALYTYNIEETAADAPTPYQPFFSQGLNRLFQKDRDATREGEIGAVDFDPVIAGQDGEAKGIKVSLPSVTGDRAELEVSFRNGTEKVTLYYSLKREGGGWKVDDIAKKQGQYPWSLRSLLGER